MNKTVSILTEGAMCIALAFVLSFIQYSGSWLQGGSVTLEAVPIIIFGMRHGLKWGLGTGFVYSCLCLIMGFNNVLYCPTLLTQIGCVMLDYIFAYTILGAAGLFVKIFKNKKAGYPLAAFTVSFLKFVCHYISGIWLWGEYAPEGQPVWLYSLIYNGTYMLADTVIAVVLVTILIITYPGILTGKKRM